MADIVQNVIIDFQVDASQLTTAQEQLAKGGKIDTTGFDAIKKSIATTSTDTKGLIQDFKRVAATAITMGKSVEDAFGAGIQDALDEAGVSVEEFSAALTAANKPAKSLKQELKELKDALAEAKLNGTDTGEAFKALRDRAGEVADAIGDAGAEIKNAASDSRQIDNIVGSITALAGGFAAAQGAAALFGDENEDVQKALLKVNGAMALATGLQQIYNATLKEGALTKLADSIATGTQSAATTLYTFVTGGATVATKAFRAALLATGIGAIVVLIVTLVNAMSDLGDATGETTESLKEQKDAADALVESLGNVATAASEARAAQAGGSDEIKRQIALAQARGKNSKEVFDLEQKLRQQEIKELKVLGYTYVQEYETRKKLGTLTLADQEALNAKVTEINRKGKDKVNEIEAASIAFAIDQAKKLEDAAKKRAENDKKAADKRRAERDAELRDTLAFLERDLLASTKGSEIELELKKKIVAAKRDIELNGEKVTVNEALLIRAKALVDQLELQKAFNAKLTEDELKSQIDRNNAVLSGIAATGEERIRLQLENIEATAQLEINAANGNAAKIIAIEADKQAKIRAVKNAAIEQDLQDQLKSVETINQIIVGALQRQAADYKNSRDVRIGALRAIENIELTAVDKAIEANDKKLQSDEDYQRKNKELQDQKLKINADTNAKIQEDDKAAAKARQEQLIKTANNYLAVAQQVADFYSSLASLAAEQDRQRIEQQKAQLAALVEAGAITEKQAKLRAQQIEIAERKAKQQQAQRDKQAAVFKAVLAIPTAFLQGLSQGGIYLAAIYAALAAAQAAVVIAKPVPKFFRGKKDSYEGRGIVGDMGSELVERNGRMFLYTRPTETHIGKRDKVYTAGETRQILHNTRVNTTMVQGKTKEFDYDRLAKAIPKSSFSVNIDKDGFTEFMNQKGASQKIFNNRYKWQ